MTVWEALAMRYRGGAGYYLDECANINAKAIRRLRRALLRSGLRGRRMVVLTPPPNNLGAEWFKRLAHPSMDDLRDIQAFRSQDRGLSDA